MRANRTWRLVATLTVLLLLAGSDVCLLSTCPALAAQALPPSVASGPAAAAAGRAPETPSHPPPRAPLHGATGIRAPPSA